MKISKLLGLCAVASLLMAPSAFAQVTAESSNSDYGPIAYFKNIENIALYAVGFLMVIVAVIGAVVAFFAIGTFKDNISTSPQSGQADWGKFIGQFVLASLFLSGSAWLWTVASSLGGSNIQDGAGKKVRDRYKG
jgi:hypothetical protein